MIEKNLKTGGFINMGYRMIIADDEEMLILLIRKLGHFEEMGIEIVDECRNGEEAYESILRNSPDFVLTDIQMPVLDGLQLIDKVCQTNKEILFVLLSGYRYFEYAQSAIRLNVVDYLLKPVDEAQLNNVLEHLCRLTDERRQRNMDRESFYRIQNTQKKKKQQSFWKAITNVGEKADSLVSDPNRLMEQYEIDLPYANVQMLFLNIGIEDDSSMAALSFVEVLDRSVKSIFADKVVHYERKMKNGYYVLLNFTLEDMDTIRKGLSVFYYSSKEQWEKYWISPITMGISQIHTMPIRFSCLALEAETASWGRMVLAGSQTIRYEQLSSMERFSSNAVYTERLSQQLSDGVRYLKRKDVAGVFSEVNGKVSKYRYAFPGDARQLFLNMEQTILSAMPADNREKEKAMCENAARQAHSYSDYLQKLFAVVEDYIAEQKQFLEEKNRKPVELAIEYTRRNYALDISLGTVAEAVGLSPTYLSRIFKERMGMGFNEYLTEMRLEESKHYLVNTKLHIREVAMSVGYLDEKYFSKLFKERYGIKPTDYRKLYG